MGTREQSQKIVGNKGTSNRLGNRENKQKITRPYVFYINMGAIEDFLLFSDFFGKFLFPFRVYSSLALALKSSFPTGADHWSNI